MEIGLGKRDVAALPLDLLPGFLFGIEGHRVKPELQEKIARYRRECFRVLWEAFRPQIVRAEDLVPPPGISGAQLAYEIATAVQHLARQQLELEERLNAAGRWAKGMEGNSRDMSKIGKYLIPCKETGVVMSGSSVYSSPTWVVKTLRLLRVLQLQEAVEPLKVLTASVRLL